MESNSRKGVLFPALVLTENSMFPWRTTTENGKKKISNNVVVKGVKNVTIEDVKFESIALKVQMNENAHSSSNENRLYDGNMQKKKNRRKQEHELLYAEEHGVSFKAYEVASEALAFSSREGRRGDCVERALRNLKRLRKICAASDDDDSSVIEKRKRNERSAVGKLVDWIQEEDGGDSVKACRLGIRAVTVQTKHIRSSDNDNNNNNNNNMTTMTSNYSSNNNNQLIIGNAKTLEKKKSTGLSRMVSKAVLKAGLRKSKKEGANNKNNEDLHNASQICTFVEDIPQPLYSEEQRRIAVVAAEKYNDSKSNDKLVKVTMTLLDEKNTKILKFVSTKAQKLTKRAFDPNNESVKEAVFNAVTPSFVAKKVHSIEIAVVDVTGDNADAALTSTEEVEKTEEENVDKNFYDPDRFPTMFRNAVENSTEKKNDSGGLGVDEDEDSFPCSNMTKASIIPRRNYPILGRVLLPIASIGDTSLKSASRNLTLALDSTHSKNVSIGTVDASVDSFFSIIHNENGGEEGASKKKKITPAAGDLDILQFAKLGIATMRFFLSQLPPRTMRDIDKSNKNKIADIREVLLRIALTHCNSKDVFPRSAVSMCEAYALFENWHPENMLLQRDDTMNSSAEKKQNNNDVTIALAFRDAMADVAAAIVAERCGEFEKVYFAKLANETRDVCIRTLEMTGFDDTLNNNENEDPQANVKQKLNKLEDDDFSESLIAIHKKKTTTLIVETLAIVSEPLGKISEHSFLCARLSRIARQCGVILFRTRLNKNISDAIGRISLSGTLKTIMDLKKDSKSDARKISERFPSASNAVFFAFEASLSRALNLASSALNAAGEKGFNPKYEGVVKSIDAELFLLAKLYEEEIPSTSGFSFFSKSKGKGIGKNSTNAMMDKSVYYSQSVFNAYKKYERAVHPAIQESVEFASEKLKRFVSFNCVGSHSDFPNPIAMNPKLGDMHSSASEDALIACVETYDALSFAMQPKYRRRFHVEKIALAIKESLVKYSDAQKAYASTLIKSGRSSEYERLTRDEDLSVEISSVFHEDAASFYGRVSNAHKCFEGFVNLMEDCPRCWKRITKNFNDDEDDDQKAHKEELAQITNANIQIQNIASSAYKNLKSNRDEMLLAFAELFSQSVSRDLKVAIFDMSDGANKYATWRCLKMMEAEIQTAAKSLSPGCMKMFLKALHAGILDAVERIVLSARLEPFSTSDMTCDDTLISSKKNNNNNNNNNFDADANSFFDASRTKINETTHSRCVQLCDAVSDFFNADFNNGSGRALRDIQRSEKRTRRLLDLWYTPTMEVANLVPEEEETREGVRSMDVLRILKQRGERDEWAKDVVKRGSQNLARSLCARLIKTYNDEQPGALLGCWTCRSDFGLRGCVFITTSSVGFTTVGFGVRFDSAEIANEHKDWICEVDRMCALLRIECKDGTPGANIQLDDRRSLYLSEFGDEEISYALEKRAIERDLFVTTLRTHEKFAPKGGKRPKKREAGNDTGSSEFSYQPSIIPPVPREFNVLPSTDPQQKVYEDLYKIDAAGDNQVGMLSVNRYSLQFLPEDETKEGCTFLFHKLNSDIVRKMSVGWTNTEVWICENLTVSGLDDSSADELLKLIKVGIAMANK
jgi:hypothetical protein